MTVAHFIKLCYPDSILVCRYVLCLYVHGYFGKIQIASYSRRSGDSCFIEHCEYHFHSKITGAHSICSQISGDINEHFVY